MIIDIHSHLGKVLNFDMQEKVLVDSMEKYGIAFTIVSNIEGAEVDHSQKILSEKNQFDQFELNERLINIVKKHPDKLGAALWIKPLTVGCDEKFLKLIEDNREYIYALKVHPYLSAINFDDERVLKYIEAAEKYNLPVVTHTGGSYGASAELVYKVAKMFPNVNFVMYHMGLGTDNEEAIELISKLPNLYGDTSWVKPEKVIKAIKICGEYKIMFGTDNPINGAETYNDEVYYNTYFDDMKERLGQEGYDKLMYKNAIKLFGIKIDKL